MCKVGYVMLPGIFGKFISPFFSLLLWFTYCVFLSLRYYRNEIIAQLGEFDWISFRSYYRCTHQKLYSCPAKKQVQRDDEDPHMFIVTYRGNHTCNISGTSPSALSQPSDQMSHIHDHQILISQAMSNTGPLSLTNSYSVVTTPLLSRTGLSVDYGKELADHFPAVVDMADVMFNSGGSYSTNSMEFLFPSMESADDHPRKLND